jgi:hypothetical protein
VNICPGAEYLCPEKFRETGVVEHSADSVGEYADSNLLDAG